MPGWSHSSIVGFTGKSTPKMQLGTDVHNYLLTPVEYDHHNRDLVLPIAKELRNHVGEVLFRKMEPELAVTCEMEWNGFKLLYKGRLDLCIFGKLVVDFKISDVPLAVSKERYGYDNQQSGYAIASDAIASLIIRVSPKSIAKGKPISETYNVPISQDWWKYQIVQKGEPIL